MISYKMNNPIAGLRATSGESREMLRRLRKNRARALRVREKLSAQYGAVLLDGDGAEIGWIEAEIAQCDQYRTRGEAMIHELERRLSKGVAVEGGVFETSIEADPVARAVREIAAEGRWIGTATRLLELVRERVSPAPDDQTFPGAAHVLSGDDYVHRAVGAQGRAARDVALGQGAAGAPLYAGGVSRRQDAL